MQERAAGGREQRSNRSEKGEMSALQAVEQRYEDEADRPGSEPQPLS